MGGFKNTDFTVVCTVKSRYIIVMGRICYGMKFLFGQRLTASGLKSWLFRKNIDDPIFVTVDDKGRTIFYVNFLKEFIPIITNCLWL